MNIPIEDGKTLRVLCTNNKQYYTINKGDNFFSYSEGIKVEDSKTGESLPALAVLVDHKLKSLTDPIYGASEIEFITYSHADGRRTYIRSLCFLLQVAVRHILPKDYCLEIQHSLPSGMYCELIKNSVPEKPSEEVIAKIKSEMERLVSLNLPFGKRKMLAGDAIEVFEENGQKNKANLQRSIGAYRCSVYSLDGIFDTFHGPLVPHTGFLKVFDITAFSDGFCVAYPSDKDHSKPLPFSEDRKLASALKDHYHWCKATGIEGVGSLNQTVLGGGAISLINLAEARQERKYAEIANKIYDNRENIRIVFIAGPSSSGKTSSSLRLAQQCRVLGMKPKVIELDNYFINRELTPRDEFGELDFESLYAMDLDLLGRHLNTLLSGGTVEIPRYDFKEGKQKFEGNMLTLGEDDILIMEGIHALNPDMVPSVDRSKIFRVYVSALTSLSLDENSNISTSDNRLLRRMVRDNRVRGITPENTILRWNSVRRGERVNIFPYQENADAFFNSALIYELPMLKFYAEPLLRRISPSSSAYNEAVRLLKFLGYIVALGPDEVAAIPPTSIMREFIGGQTL